MEKHSSRGDVLLLAELNVVLMVESHSWFDRSSLLDGWARSSTKSWKRIKYNNL